MSFSVYKFMKRIQVVENNKKVDQNKAIDLIELVSSAKQIDSEILSDYSMDDIENAINIIQNYNYNNPKQNCVLAQMIISQHNKDNLKNVKNEITSHNEDFF